MLRTPSVICFAAQARRLAETSSENSSEQTAGGSVIPNGGAAAAASTSVGKYSAARFVMQFSPAMCADDEDYDDDGLSGGCAAFIMESVLSCGGQVMPPAGYLRRVYAAVSV